MQIVFPSIQAFPGSIGDLSTFSGLSGGFFNPYARRVIDDIRKGTSEVASERARIHG